MTLGARRYSDEHHFDFLRRALAVAAITFLFSSLLCAVFSETHYDPHLQLQSLLPAHSNPYFSFLDRRFDFYFSSETFSPGPSLPPDYQQATPTFSLLTASSQPAVSEKPNKAAISLKASPVVQHPALTPPGLRQGMPQSSASAPGTQKIEGAENLSGGNTPAFQRFFAKLFGKLSPNAIRFASAAEDDSQLGARSATSRYDQGTAVYDISAHTVYMPDGTKLEAHSGFGKRLDDPTRVAERISRSHSTGCLYPRIARSTFSRGTSFTTYPGRRRKSFGSHRFARAHLHARSKWPVEWLCVFQGL